MADYYPLIARAIAGLDPSAPGESRRALYERARAALIAQLRSVQPPLSESEITRERLSLEEAVRKVEESEAAQARPRRVARRRRPLRRRVPRQHPAQCAAGRNGAAFDIAGPAPAPAFAARAQRAAAPDRKIGKTSARRATFAPMRRPPRGHNRPIPSRKSRCRIHNCRRPASARARRAAAPTTAPRKRLLCAGSATSPPTPTISAAPRPRPTAPRERPMPTCPRPRRSSTGSSRAWRTAAPIPIRPIRTTSRSRRRSATRSSRRRRDRGSRRTANRSGAPAPERCFRSRARSRSASC